MSVLQVYINKVASNIYMYYINVLTGVTFTYGRFINRRIRKLNHKVVDFDSSNL